MPISEYAPPPASMQKRKVTDVVPPPGFDAGDGVIIPPLPNNPYAPPPPSTNATGGPTQPASDIRSGIFEDLYRTGKRMDFQPLMDFAQSPVEEADPMAGIPPLPQDEPVTPPLYAQPMAPLPGPMPGQGPGPNAPMRRFPRATSLIPRSAPAMSRGGY